MWKCPTCGETYAIGLAIGEPICEKDNSIMQKVNASSDVKFLPISIGGEVNVGGHAHNSGTIKIFSNGNLTVNKDLINTGVISVNDPERMKELLAEMVKASGTVAELGTNILKTFFNISK